MTTPKLNRAEAVDRIAEVFRRCGYEGASLSMFSSATGLGRASLYHHFPGGKEDMARAVFARVNALVGTEILKLLEGPGTPQQRLSRWVAAVARLYADGKENCLLGAMVLSGGSDRFATELRDAFRAWIAGLARLLREAGLPAAQARRRAENAMGRIQGALIVSRGIRDTKHFERVLSELPGELLARR